jgi:hypothetical protein
MNSESIRDCTIDYISLGGLGWAHFRAQLIAFGHARLPTDVHFTISYDRRSEDVNFHLTRNVHGNEKKPKISIACINKELLDKLQARIAQTVFSKLFLPLDISFWRSKYGRRLYYLSFADIEQDCRKVGIEAAINNEFQKLSHIKGKTQLKTNFPNE